MTIFAPPPLSTTLASGQVTADGGMHAFAGIDMTAWATEFLATVQGLFAPDMAAAIERLDPNRAAALAGLKTQLADAIAATLAPVLIVAGEDAVVPAELVARFRQALLDDLGSAWLRDTLALSLFPPLPAIVGQSAIGPASPASLAEALTWSFQCDIAAPQAMQDELLLSVMLNGMPDPLPVPVAAAGDDPLLEALARFTFEYPGIAPDPDRPADDPDAARRALARMEALVAEVAGAWPNRARPTPDEADRADPATWTYRIDFSPQPALGVTRMPGAPWPRIAGFATPPDSGQATDVYAPLEPPPDDAPLIFTFAGLSATGVQSARAAARVIRNANIVPPDAPEGTGINPAFVYRTPRVAANAPVAPLLEYPSRPFAAGAGAGTLSAAIDDVLAPFLAKPESAGLAVRALRLEVGGAYWFRLAGEGQDEAIRSGNQVFLVRTDVVPAGEASGGAVTAAAFRQGLVDALTGWHAAMQPSDAGASIQLAITLYAAGDRRVPLVRLDAVEIAVPQGRPDWWA